MKTVTHEEFLKLKEEAANKQNFPKNSIELIVGHEYLLANFDLIKIKSIDKEKNQLHYFNFTQQCNVYPKLSTFTVKNKV